MCGVIGFASKDPTRSHLLKIISLFKESKIRGLHAFGFTTWEPNWLKDGLATKKFNSILAVEAALREYELNPPEILIGHTRYSTSGDFHDHSNNQPIHVPGVSLVFNGVISMKTKEEREKEFKTLYTTDNDGEIVSRKIIGGEDAESFVAEGRFSFAGLYMSNGEIKAIRNKNRPLWYSKTDDAVFVASTKDIFRRAGKFSAPIEILVGKEVDLKCLL